MGMNNELRHTNGQAIRLIGRQGNRLGWKRLLAGVLLLGLLGPAVPAFGTTAPAGQNVTLIWNPAPANNRTGYNLYYGTASGAYSNMIKVGNVTNATIPGLTAGVTYFFAAVTYNASGELSSYSNEASFAVPTTIPALQLGRAAAGRYMLTVNGPAGQTNAILATQDFKTWTVIGTVMVGTGGTVNFTDTNAANFPQRFYRIQ